MNWVNKNTVPYCLDFNVILEQMLEHKINGKSLTSLKKIDLLHIGFKIHAHRTMIYQFIQSLITKNKIPNDAELDDVQFDDESNTNDEHIDDVNGEGVQSTNDRVMNEIPDRYKCALTKKVMSEPVICGHNNKVFEKKAIYDFINENERMPLVTAGGDNQINVNDEASFLLFDDMSLKIEIEQFKQEHNA